MSASAAEDRYTPPEQVLDEAEAYARNSGVVALFRDISVQTFKARPEEPARFLIEYLSQTYPIEADKVLKEQRERVKQRKPVDDEPLAVTISHTDSSKQEYLVHQVKLEQVVLKLGEALLAQRPSGGQELSLMIEVLQDLQLERKERMVQIEQELEQQQEVTQTINHS